MSSRSGKSIDETPEIGALLDFSSLPQRPANQPAPSPAFGPERSTGRVALERISAVRHSNSEFERPSQLRDNLLTARRTIATSFDALVRTARRADPGMPALARRVFEQWSMCRDVAIELGPTQLVVDGEVVISPDPQAGRWVLPAFMSGLRKLRLRSDAGCDDLVRIAQELGTLTATLAAIDALRDWLWSDGAQGFDVELADSFVELGDVALSQFDVQRQILALRSVSAVDTWNAVCTQAAQEVDAAALREEFAVPLADFQERALARDFELASVDGKALAQRLEDPVAWSTLETDAVLGHAELRAHIPPQRMAARLLGLAEGSEHLDSRVLVFLGTLAEREDAFAVEVFRRLDSEAFGRVLGERIDMSAGIERLAVFVERAPEGTARGFVSGLLGRGAGDGSARAPLQALSLRWGLGGLLSRSDPAAMTEALTAILVKSALDGRASVGAVRDFLARVPPRSAALTIAFMPRLLRVCPVLARTLLARHPAEAAPLLVRIARSESSALPLLRDALLDCSGEGYPDRLLELLLRTLVRGRLGEPLVSLVRARETPVRTRVAALKALRDAPRQLATACQWRASEWLDPPDVKEALQEARAWLTERD